MVAIYLRIDTIEHTLRRSLAIDPGAAGYAVAMALAEQNLRLGHIVVVDCVNPVAESRAGWTQVAQQAGKKLLDVEIICSDLAEHRRRVESRVADLPGHRLPSWNSVRHHEYAPWTSERLVIDTADLSPTDAVNLIAAKANQWWKISGSS